MSILGCTGVKSGGRLSDAKPVLIQRLAKWLNQVVDAGRHCEKTCDKDDDESLRSSRREDEGVRERYAKKARMLIPRVDAIGKVPFDAIVNPEQAESALGHAQATEFDDELLDMVDLDQRAEEEALLKKKVNPAGVDYSSLFWS